MNTTPIPKIPESSHSSSFRQTQSAKMADSNSTIDKNSSFSSQSNFSTDFLTCSICSKQYNNPHMLPCLHVFCLNCLRDECVGKTTDKYFCPLCVPENDTIDSQKSHQSRAWHSFQRILEQETGNEELQRRMAELPASSSDNNSPESWDKDSNDSSDPGDSEFNRKPSILEPPVLFPCTMHPDRLSDTFCLKCDQLACHKCVSSFHRRCQSFSGLKEAVDSKRGQFDSIHDNMAANLVACEDVVEFQTKRSKAIENMRTEVLVQIKKFRTDLVNAILDKEKALTREANRMLDELQHESSSKNKAASKLANSLHRQMELLDLSFSVQGEGELLPFLPGIASRIETDSRTINSQHCESLSLSRVSFIPDIECKSMLDASSLGNIHVEGDQEKRSPDGTVTGNDVTQFKPDLDLDLSLVTSFHGGTREDFTEPLLTDLIVVANGDIILTDRDNKCVKKFNRTGKLLTRVLIDAVPSRIATVSHARAVVSVMNKKCLYFLSLFGTVRVLHTTKVKKLYSFLTSLGNGLLAAGTNLCETIDVLNERGETIRSIFTQKHDKASISRPLYLTPAIPKWTNILSKNTGTSTNNKNHISSEDTNTNMNGDNETGEVTNNTMDVTSRRQSINKTTTTTTTSNNETNAKHQNSTTTNGSIKSSSSSTNSTNSSKKAGSKKRNSLNSTSKKSSISLSTTDSLLSPSTSSSSPSSSPSSWSPSEHDILVSDSGKRIMFLLEKDGTVGFTLRSNDQLKLECPLGVTVHEKGLTLLVDRDSDCVLLLDKCGSLLKRILTDKDGLVKPCGIYADAKGGVVLSQVDGTVKIYKTVH